MERRFLGTWGRNNGLLTAIISIALAWAAYELARRSNDPLRFVYWTHNILLVTAAYGLIQVLGQDPIAWSSGSMKVFATFGNTNFAAAAWALGAICGSILLFFGRKSFVKSSGQLTFYLLTVALFIFLTYTTKSIQGLFALAAFYVLVTISKLWTSKKILFRLLSLILISFGLLIAHSLFFKGPLTSLVSTAGSLGFRKIYWEIGLRIFSSNPILGAGVDSYGDYYRTVRTSDMATTTSIDLVVNNAHNTFIQTLATLGLIGAFALVAPFLVADYFAIRRALSHEVDAITAISFAFISLWLMATFSIDNISITLWNWLFLGLSLGSCRRKEDSEEKPIQNQTKSKNIKKNVRTGTGLYDYSKVATNVIAAFLLFVLWNNVAVADRKLVTTFRSPASFDQPETISNRLDSLGEISRLSVLDPQHYMMLGRALVELQQIPQSIDVLSKGTLKFPRDFALWDNLAYSLEQQGRFPEAITARERQVELDPRHARVWSYLAQDYQKNGDDINARRAAQQSLANLSVFAPSDQDSIRSFLSQLGLI
jgi:O-antigen ligase